MTEGTDFLYPFIEAGERDPGPLLRDLAESARAKATTSAALRTATLERSRAELYAAADEVAARLDAGGRVFTFGNGGSATDAAGVARLFARPPWGRAVPARTLAQDPAVLTALGNDVGFELVFARQLIAYAGAGDVAIGVSTSGNSRNVVVGLAEARRRHMTTVGLAGYDGGEMAQSGAVDYCLVVGADSVHRIQETQAAVAFTLWALVQERLDG